MAKKMTLAAAVAAMALSAAVDRLGVIKAAKAEIEKEEELLKAKLKANGGRMEGDLFEANVVEQTRETVDYKAIAEKVGYSHQLKAAHTYVTPIVMVKVTAKTGEMAKAA